MYWLARTKTTPPASSPARVGQGRPETADALGFGDLPEAQGGDQHTTAVGHDRGDDLLRQLHQETDGRADEQATGGQPAPETRL